MSSIFAGQSGLRHRYKKLLFSDISAATGAANAVLLIKLDMGGRLVFLDNTMNADVALLLVNPKSDPTVAASRLLWFEIGANRVVNYDLSSAIGLQFDPGTSVYVYPLTVPTSGTVKILAWA